MSSFLETIKLSLFEVLRTPYKKKLFKDVKINSELTLLSQLLSQEQLFFIDVGANRGEFIYFAEKVLSPSKIWAFEPLPYFAKKLQALFPNITVFNLGLSDTETKTILYVPLDNGVPDDSLSSIIKPSGSFNSYNIDCTTLDSIIKRESLNNEKIFLKIDVEGYEFNVLKGSEKTIKDSVLIMLIEIEERHHKQKSLKEMIDEVESMGFTCYHLHSQTSKLIRYSNNSEVHQKKEDLNTRAYINNFWFFSIKIDHYTLINKLNNSI